MSRLCPDGKMSCIGKYQRNVLNFPASVKLSLAWGFFPIFRQFILLTYEKLDGQVSPEYIFYADSVLWILCSDAFYTYLNLRVTRRGIPSNTEIPGTSNFSDLSKHSKALEARKATVDNSNKRRPILQVDRIHQGRACTASPEPFKRVTVPIMLRSDETSSTQVFESNFLAHKFCYFQKLQRIQSKSVADKIKNIEMRRQEVAADSSKNILLYSRHMNVVHPERGNII